MYVPIEKNVTRVIQSMVTSLGFQEHNFCDSMKYQVPAVVVLRDPVQRWVSGLVEYFLEVYLDTVNTENNMTRQNITIEYAFEQIVFDRHTCPQYRFIEQLQGPRSYVWFDQDQKPQLIETLVQYFNERGFSNNWSSSQLVEKYKYNDAIPDQKKELTQQIKHMLKKPDLFKKIKKFYSKDYELIKSVKFYS